MAGTSSAKDTMPRLLCEGGTQSEVIARFAWRIAAALATSSAELSVKAWFDVAQLLKHGVQTLAAESKELWTHTLLGLRHCKALQLRSPAQVRSLLEVLMLRGFRPDDVAEALCKLPWPAAAALGVVACRGMSALNAVGDAILDEVIFGRTLTARLVLLILTAPVCLVLHQNRQALLEDAGPCPHVIGLSTARPCMIWVWLRNVQRLPPLAGVAVTTSGAVVVHTAQVLGEIIVKRLLRLRIRRLLPSIAAALMFLKHYRLKGSSLSEGAIHGFPYMLSVRVCKAQNLQRRASDGGRDTSKTQVLVRVGNETRRLPVVGESGDMLWNSGNEFSFGVDIGSLLEVEVVKVTTFSAESQSGKTQVEMKDLRLRRWLERNVQFHECFTGSVELELRLDRAN